MSELDAVAEAIWRQIGTVEVLRPRVYPIDPAVADRPLSATAWVAPGTFPVYRKYDAVMWIMRGNLNERHAKIGDGLFSFTDSDVPTGLEVQFPSPTFGIEQFEAFLAEPICQPGSSQRLRFSLTDGAVAHV